MGFFFISFKIFPLNKVNWLPQYYSQYNPRDHFSLSLCYSLLCGFCISVILKTVEEMSALASCGNKGFLCLTDSLRVLCIAMMFVYTASLTACLGQYEPLSFFFLWRWELKLEALPLSDMPSTHITFLFWDRLTNLPQLTLNSLWPRQAVSPGEAFPSVWSIHFTFEMAEYFWYSTMLFVALMLLWIFKRKPTRLSAQGEQEP